MKIKTLENQPVILPSALWIWNAFEMLSGRRLFNQAGPQPIQLTEILSFACFAGIIDEWRKDLLVRMIVKMDTIFLDHHLKKKPGKNKSGSGKRVRK